jgi:hypothetical protein
MALLSPRHREERSDAAIHGHNRDKAGLLRREGSSQ